MNVAAPQVASLLAGWNALPLAVRERLALAGTGWPHLARAGADCLRAARQTGEGGDPALLETAAQLLLWAWGEAPLNGPLAAEILAAPDLPLPEAARAGLTTVASGWRAPSPQDSGMAYFQRLAEKRDPERLAQFLAGQVAKDPAGLFWREKALALALFAGQGEISEGLHAAALSGLDNTPALAPLAANLRAQAAFLRGDTEACLAALRGMGDCFGPAFGPARAGLALLDADKDADKDAGEDSPALPLLLAALRCVPWQAALALVAADALTGARREVSPPPGPVALLLYSWNKADDLDATLSSLAASELHGAKILVLNNGSTDRTAQVLEGWKARLGGQLETITLPVNIGAAAARNWLAATETARASETIVYLDDDVDVPANWLGKLGAAMRRMPDAGVWGCKVADHAAPRLLQNVAGMLTIPPEAPKGTEEIDWQSLSPNPFRLLDAHLHGPDWGLFDHISPCSSVTGCCHAFRRSWLDAAQKDGGGFSLMLMPSQYDDFERDLRMLDGGASAAYTGHLRVRHRKRSGIESQAGQKDTAGANAAGNRYKMQCMHDRASIARHIGEQDRRAQEHVRACLVELAQLDATGEIS